MTIRKLIALITLALGLSLAGAPAGADSLCVQIDPPNGTTSIPDISAPICIPLP